MSPTVMTDRTDSQIDLWHLTLSNFVVCHCLCLRCLGRHCKGYFMQQTDHTLSNISHRHSWALNKIIAIFNLWYCLSAYFQILPVHFPSLFCILIRIKLIEKSGNFLLTSMNNSDFLPCQSNCLINIYELEKKEFLIRA